MIDLVREALEQSFPQFDSGPLQFRRLSGGDCSEVYLVSQATHKEALCLKVLRKKNSGQLRIEMLSLLALRAHLGKAVPRAYGVCERGSLQILLLEYLGEQASADSAGLGQLLDKLHTGEADRKAAQDLLTQLGGDAEQLFVKFSSGCYLGFYCDNFIGLTPQRNAIYKAEQWPEFFAELRLLPMMLRCREQGLLQKRDVRAIEALCTQLPELLPRLERASLLHGDLWAGNVYWCAEGPVLIDPACYYGHYEVDLAMTRLFSGFSAEFYESYNEPGAGERFAIYNLYHLLNHLLFFGSSYYSGVWNTIKAWA